MTAEQLAQLRKVAERANPEQYGYYLVDAFTDMVTPATVLTLLDELERKDKRIAELEAISSAAEKLVRCKGRYHSEQNYRALAALLGVTTPDLPPLESEARTVTVKLPDVERWRSVDAVRAQNAYRVLVIKTLAETGINLTVEG
ncbi:ead/Ea22-like family protein [Atlantibacter hermannii]|uniref:ead/Ea22-like family protein n=1 Tax=Atlantibacter hermannii TaxID=565 RepID=UPI0028AC442F|nr:ead/Ea22-like family protein [Atlantibacter hermannii]